MKQRYSMITWLTGAYIGERTQVRQENGKRKKKKRKNFA